MAQVNVNGATKYAVRIQADPDALAARGIGIDTLANADQRHQCQPGHRRAERRQATPRSSIPTASWTTPTQFRNQIIAYSNGAPVRLGDVANVIDSSDNIRSGRLVPHPARRLRCRFSASPAPTPSRWCDKIKSAAAAVPGHACPPAIKLEIRHDRSETIRASVDDVQETLLIAAVLVVG